MKQEQGIRRRTMSWYEANVCLWDYLLEFSEKLEQMRDSFGIGPEVGFAHLSLGTSGTPAFVAEISLEAGIPSQCLMKQLVKPELNVGHGKLVTIALPDKQFEADPQQTTEFFKNQKAFAGFIAHELAHCVAEIEPEISKAIEYIPSRLDHPTENARYQAQTDLLACVFGYSEEILEALTSWLSLIKETKTGSRKEIRETRFRIQAVKRFQRI